MKIKEDKSPRVNDVAALLVPGENVLGSCTSMRDYVVFTDRRLITLNVQGVTGKKKDYTTLPYSKVSAFSVETAGILDLDCELELWFSGLGKVKFDFSEKSDIVTIGQAISAYILK